MNRCYVGVCRYPGKEEFVLGNVVADARAKDHEIRPLLVDLWREISPHPCPEITQIISGSLFLKEDL